MIFRGMKTQPLAIPLSAASAREALQGGDWLYYLNKQTMTTVHLAKGESAHYVYQTWVLDEHMEWVLSPYTLDATTSWLSDALQMCKDLAPLADWQVFVDLSGVRRSERPE